MSVTSRTCWEHSVLIDQSKRLVVSGNGLVVTTNNGVNDCWLGGVASNSVDSGKAYFEVKCNLQPGGMCRFGWSREADKLGRDGNSIIYGTTHMKSDGGVFRNHGRRFNNGDVIGCYLDFEERIVSFTVNGVSQGIAFSKVPLVDKKSIFQALYPAYWLKSASAEFNFGASPFAYAPTDITSDQQLEGSRLDCFGLRFSSNQLVVINYTDKWCGGVASHLVSKGKFFYEVKCIAAADGGSFRLGWSQLAGMYDNSPLPLDIFYDGNGMKSYDGKRTNYGTRFGIDDVIGCYLDCDLKTVSYTVNGVFQGVAFTHNPTYTYTMKFESLYPAYWLKNASAEFNFGASPFIYSPGDFHDSSPRSELPHMNEMSEYGETKLHRAVYGNNCNVYRVDYAVVTNLINCGANVELKNRKGRTPLHLATLLVFECREGDFEMAHLLVELGGSNIFARCGTGLTPIDMIITARPESAQSLIKSSRWPRRGHFIHFLYFCKLFLVSDSIRNRQVAGVGSRLVCEEVGLDWHYADIISPRWDTSADVKAAYYIELAKSEQTALSSDDSDDEVPIAKQKGASADSDDEIPIAKQKGASADSDDAVAVVNKGGASRRVDTSAFKRVMQQNSLIGCIASFL